MNKRKAKKRRKKEFVILQNAICTVPKGELYSSLSQMGIEVKKSNINIKCESFSLAEMIIRNNKVIVNGEKN